MFLLSTSEHFPILENKLIGYADDFTLIAIVPSPGVRIIVAKSLWDEIECEYRTKTMLVSRSRTMLFQSPALTIAETVLKESEDLVILGVTFDSKMTFEKHLRSVSRAASQRFGILRKYWQVFHDRLLLGWSNFSASFRVLALKLTELIRFALRNH